MVVPERFLLQKCWNLMASLFRWLEVGRRFLLASKMSPVAWSETCEPGHVEDFRLLYGITKLPLKWKFHAIFFGSYLLPRMKSWQIKVSRDSRLHVALLHVTHVFRPGNNRNPCILGRGVLWSQDFFPLMPLLQGGWKPKVSSTLHPKTT